MRRLYSIACALALPCLIRAQAVNLGTAAAFGVLGASTVTNTGPTFIQGDVGVFPGTAITGFPPGIQSLSSSMHVADAVALQARSDAQIAYGVAAGLPPSSPLLTGTDLGGLSLTPGVYFFSSSSQLTGTLTLDAQGDKSALFVFQIGSTLITASNSAVSLINGAQACNVIWQVGTSATLGSGTDFVGIILAQTSISANSDASVSGSLIALTGAVTLDDNAIEVVDTCATSTTTTASTSSTTTIPILDQGQTSGTTVTVTVSISATSTTSLPTSTALLSPTSSTLLPTSSLSTISTNSASVISGQTTLTSQAADTSLPASTSTFLNNLQINSLPTLLTATATSSSSITSMTTQFSTLASLSNNATTIAQSTALGSQSNVTSTSSALGSASNGTSTNTTSAGTSGAEYTISSTSNQLEVSFLSFTTITTTKCVTLTKFLFEESCTCYKSHLETITETFTIVVPCSTPLGIPPSSSTTAPILNQASNFLIVTSPCTSLETVSPKTQSGATRSRETTDSLRTSSPTTSAVFTGPGNRLTVGVNCILFGVTGIALLIF